jgi:hypothetical protein
MRRSPRPFGVLPPGHTYFALLSLTKLTAHEKRGIAAMSNDRDEVLVRGRDVHWLIRAKSTETTLGPKQLARCLAGQPHYCAKHDDADQAGRAPVSQATDVPR